MVEYGRISTKRLKTCKHKVQDLFNDVISCLPWTDPVSGITIHDCSILCGHRDEIAQDLAYKQGNSLVKYPDSKHNFKPCAAVDSAPYHAEKPHIHWNDMDEMEAYKRLVFICAKKRKMTIRWGNDWDQDGIRVDKDPDESFVDAVHYEWIED